VVNSDRLFGSGNHAVLGASFDGADTGFDAVARIGGLSLTSRIFEGPGVVIDEPGTSTPVQVTIRDADYGIFGADTLDLTSRLSLTASGRFNSAKIDLGDRTGGNLSGRHGYDRFNPAIGASYRATGWLTVYGGYAEANRAPTPAELSCAGPADSCSLANFFVGDPDLKQVVSHTFEAGARGVFRPSAAVEIGYDLGLYRADLDNDIVFINSVTQGRAYFTNIGRTRRQGLDASLKIDTGRWQAHIEYAHTEAIYRTGFTEPGGANPGADANGVLSVTPGDRIPGVPANQVKLGLTFAATRRLTLGATAVGRDGAYLFGDEANVEPKLPGFFVLNLNASYQLGPRLRIFARVENVADARYYTFGTFSPTSAVFLAQAPNASNPRAYSPAAPVGVFGGLRFTF
jgi:outer membrane receptor protein involved in Fe transport